MLQRAGRPADRAGDVEPAACSPRRAAAITRTVASRIAVCWSSSRRGRGTAPDILRCRGDDVALWSCDYERDHADRADPRHVVLRRRAGASASSGRSSGRRGRSARWPPSWPRTGTTSTVEVGGVPVVITRDNEGSVERLAQRLPAPRDDPRVRRRQGEAAAVPQPRVDVRPRRRVPQRAARRPRAGVLRRRPRPAPRARSTSGGRSSSSTSTPTRRPPLRELEAMRASVAAASGSTWTTWS